MKIASPHFANQISRRNSKDQKRRRGIVTQSNETLVNQPLGRRTLMKGAGLGLVAGGLSATLPVKAGSADTEGGEIWSSEYWTKKGDVPLWMFRKRVGAPKAGEPSKPGLFFVHGSSVTSRTVE